MNRSADWLHQAHSDLDLAAVSAAAGHHEWACTCTMASRPGAMASAAPGENSPLRSALRSQKP